MLDAVCIRGNANGPFARVPGRVDLADVVEREALKTETLGDCRMTGPQRTFRESDGLTEVGASTRKVAFEPQLVGVQADHRDGIGMERSHAPSDCERAIQIGARGWVSSPAVQDQAASRQGARQPGLGRQCLGDPHRPIDGRRSSLKLVQPEMCLCCPFEIVSHVGAVSPAGRLVNARGCHVLCQRNAVLARLEQDVSQQTASGAIGDSRRRA